MYNNNINSAYSNTQLIDLIDLSTLLLHANLSIKHKSEIAIRQIGLIKEYSYRIRQRITNYTKKKFKWYYRVCTKIRSYLSKLPKITDIISYKTYFSRKIKDFRNKLNVIYIGITSKILNKINQIRG